VRPETLEDEVKRLSQQLMQNVATPSGFKGGGYQDCRRDYSLLAAVFGIVGEYDGEVRWRDEAPAYRDLFARAGFNCKVGTDQSFQEASRRAEDLEAVIRGSRIEAPEGQREALWPQVADRQPLMRRMETAHEERLGQWLSGPSEFRNRLRDIQHEAELLAALAHVISREGYEHWDDNEYSAYADQVRAGGQAIAQAVATEDFTRASEAAANITKACDSCHEGFRN
jgi:hypothetical protein